ncbi:MAG: hypothetical protein M1823_001054 [Watsoniomyces obsoletus]|nr:MAG: hypothetical protein M1823_001054 [Watsoniomyces obsoletus]
MPKKRQGFKSTKPSPTVHPSLSRSPVSTSPRPDDEASPSSVNQLLSHLRKSQAKTSGVGSSDTIRPNSELALFLGSHERTPTLQNRNRPLRRPPGPAPPPSWSNSVGGDSDSMDPEQEFDQRWEMIRNRPSRFGRCPGYNAPGKESLQHLTLKKLAQTWDVQAYYNQHHLGYLPIRLKYQLLEYIAVYGPECGLTIRDLRMLFPNSEEDPEWACNEEVTYLDLSRSIGRSISLKQLKSFLKTGSHQKHGADTHTEPRLGPAPVVRSSSNSEGLKMDTQREDARDRSVPSASDEEMEDSWEAFDDTLTHKSIPSSAFRFNNLTHLILSHPPSTISWSDLLSLAPTLATITHLSLAYWPAPSLTPAAMESMYPKRATAYDEGVLGNYATGDRMVEIAADILRRLSKATYCLKWLDLEGCFRWLRGLYWNYDGRGIEWTGPWRGLQTLIIRMPHGIFVSDVPPFYRVIYKSSLGSNREGPDGHQERLEAWTPGETSAWYWFGAMEIHVKSKIMEVRTPAACPWLDIVTTPSVGKVEGDGQDAYRSAT